MWAALFICVALWFGSRPVGGRKCWEQSMRTKGRNESCEAAQPFLIFGVGKAIHRMELDGRRQRRLVAGAGSALVLDFDYREETLYWADAHSGAIYKAALGAHKQRLFSSDKPVSGLALDWIGKRIFWTSSEKGTLQRADHDGKHRETVVRRLVKPSDIAVDPNQRFLFWLSGESSVQRSNLTGHMRTTILKSREHLRALSVDHQDQRLFWVQSNHQDQSVIGSCGYSGEVLHVSDQPLGSFSSGISIVSSDLFFTDSERRGVKRVDKYGGEVYKVNRKSFSKPLVGIRVVQKQPLRDTAPGSVAGFTAQ